MEVNTLAVFLCCPRLRASYASRGRAVASSTSPPARRLKGVPLFLHYIASKGALIAMTRGLGRASRQGRQSP